MISEKSNKNDEIWKGFPLSKVGLGKVGLWVGKEMAEAGYGGEL